MAEPKETVYLKKRTILSDNAMNRDAVTCYVYVTEHDDGFVYASAYVSGYIGGDIGLDIEVMDDGGFTQGIQYVDRLITALNEFKMAAVHARAAYTAAKKPGAQSVNPAGIEPVLDGGNV